MHVGQPERLAGEKAGARAKAEGATNAICANQEAFNTALVDRCEGYGVKTKMIDVSNDVAQIQTRVAAALQSDSSIDSILVAGPHVCDAAAKAVSEVGANIHLSCFDLSPGFVMDLINAEKLHLQLINSKGYRVICLL